MTYISNRTARIAALATGIALCWLLASARANDQSTPEQDHQRWLQHFAQRYPGARLDDYIYGAMISNPGAREQYEQIMEFPPFLGDIEAGKRYGRPHSRTERASRTVFPTTAEMYWATIHISTKN